MRRCLVFEFNELLNLFKYVHLYLCISRIWFFQAHNKMTRIQESQRGSKKFRPVATNSQFLLSEVRFHLICSFSTLLIVSIVQRFFQPFLICFHLAVNLELVFGCFLSNSTLLSNENYVNYLRPSIIF